MTLKVAVLGASGFIGNRTVEKLHLEAKAEVLPVVRSFGSLARLARFDLDCRIADALDQRALRTAFAGCELVVHAVVGNPDVILGSAEATYTAAQAAGVRRLVYLSTASVHGQAPVPGTNETSSLSSRQPLGYNNAKVLAERKLLQLRAKGSVELVMLRPGIVFGPRSRWIAGLANDLLAGRAYLVNGGEGICNSIYVDNLVHAIELAMMGVDADGHAFLVGDREKVTWRDFYRFLVEALPVDFDVPCIPCPEFKSTWKDHLTGVRSSRPVQDVLPFFPAKLKQVVKGAISAWSQLPAASGWALSTTSSPVVTQEMALLHMCSYKFPNYKAEKILGYEPIVSFEEACHRSISWLAFAG
ncbi:MAG: NAD-dependent epimerase/dehydratase family protein, partial [Gemmatimonadaceae bacterium]|nr:NAD-dependent epimerase/dehydratase family protein [Gloeobacterales cyanobacterium ES-bin-141]